MFLITDVPVGWIHSDTAVKMDGSMYVAVHQPLYGLGRWGRTKYRKCIEPAERREII